MRARIRSTQASLLTAFACACAGAWASDPAFRVEPGARTSPSITVEESRRSVTDSRIQADVIQRLEKMENVQGFVAVHTRDSIVRLDGQVSTAGQVHRVGRETRAVDGVRDVENQIRARYGPSH